MGVFRRMFQTHFSFIWIDGSVRTGPKKTGGVFLHHVARGVLPHVHLSMFCWDLSDLERNLRSDARKTGYETVEERSVKSLLECISVAQEVRR